jgi:hypothetical protein
VASPAEYGMTIILERLCISPTEAIRQEINYICNTPPSCYAPWSKKTNKQTNKQRSKQTVISIVASLKPCVASEQGKSTTVFPKEK